MSTQLQVICTGQVHPDNELKLPETQTTVIILFCEVESPSRLRSRPVRLGSSEARPGKLKCSRELEGQTSVQENGD